MKIALFASGSFYGDVGPYLEIARRLELLGHTTLLVIPEEYAAKCDGFNCCYYMGDVLSKELEETSPNYRDMIFGVVQNLLQNGFDRIDDVLNACADVDVILSHPLCAISDVVADYHDIRNIELLISSRYFNDSASDQAAIFLNNLGLANLNVCRRKLNLSDATNVSMNVFSNDNTKITLFPDFYVASDNPNVVFGNFIHYEDVTELPDALLEFINDGSPPIVFAMGSGSKHMMDPPNFNEITIEVAKKYRSVLLGKADVTHDNVFVCDFPVPHSKLFPLASLVFTHGGIGTIGKCLGSNTPQIAVPQMSENKVNADLLSHMMTVINPCDYTPENICAAIDADFYNYDIGRAYSEQIGTVDVIDIIVKIINI